MDEPADPEFVAGEVLVGFNPGTPAAERAKARANAASALADTVATGSGNYARVERVRVKPGREAAAITRFQQNSNVAFAELNWVLSGTAEPSDPYYTDGSLWGVYGDDSGLAETNQFGSQSAEAWAGGNIGDASVYVAVIDSGVQATHPDLGNVDASRGWDFYEDNESTYDGPDDDHGTHVAGTIGATANGEGVVGVAHEVGIIPVKFLGPNGGYTSDAVQAIDHVTGLKARGINVVATNNSWGGGGYSTALYESIQRAGDEGILFVAAAGNGDRRGRAVNTDGRTKHYPSSYDLPSIISVTAIQSDGGTPRWANYGASSVDLGAPGVDIWSTLPGNTYGSYSGTSMATPHVTGAVALYASLNPNATASGIKAAILDSALPTASMDGRTVTGGRLDVSSFIDSDGGGLDAPASPLTAGFTYECAYLTCDFTDTSTPETSIESRLWAFGDGLTSTAASPSHKFGVPGTYDVVLTVWGGDGETKSVTVEVTVFEPSATGGPLTITEVSTSTRGKNKVTLRWEGAEGSLVEIRRTGESSASVLTANNGEYTDNTNTRGEGHEFAYQVCETEGSECSALQDVTF